MGLSTSELSQMQADARDLSRAGSGLSVSIVIYRGSTTLPAQSVRLVSAAGSRNAQADGTEAAQTGVLVIGSIDLNIRARDRFTASGITYEVESVEPNRYVQTTAVARALQ